MPQSGSTRRVAWCPPNLARVREANNYIKAIFCRYVQDITIGLRVYRGTKSSDFTLAEKVIDVGNDRRRS